MARSIPITVRLNEGQIGEIAGMAKRSNKTPSRVTSELVDEGLRMRRFPGISFTDGAAGRRATLSGTGLDVWEVALVHRDCSSRSEDTLAVIPQVSPAQLALALAYADSFPDEIDAWLSETAKAPVEWKKAFPTLRSDS